MESSSTVFCPNFFTFSSASVPASPPNCFTALQHHQSLSSMASSLPASPPNSTTSPSNVELSPSPAAMADQQFLHATIGQLGELLALKTAAILLDQAKLAERAAVQRMMMAAGQRQQQQQQKLAQEAKELEEERSRRRTSSNDIKSIPCKEEFCSQIFSVHQPTLLTNKREEFDGNSEEHFLTRCGITWMFMTRVKSERHFDELRRSHQVSKNRHVGYGVRYACTRNAKARDNCPYLMLCMPSSDGSLRVYYRNSHSHPIRQIRCRQQQQKMADD